MQCMGIENDIAEHFHIRKKYTNISRHKTNKVLQNKLFTQSYNSPCVELGTVRRNACHSADNSLVFTLAFPVQQYVITLFTKENVYSVTMLFVGSKYILFWKWFLFEAGLSN